MSALPTATLQTFSLRAHPSLFHRDYLLHQLNADIKSLGQQFDGCPSISDNPTHQPLFARADYPTGTEISRNLLSPYG